MYGIQFIRVVLSILCFARSGAFFGISLVADGPQRARVTDPTYCNIAILPVVTKGSSQLSAVMHNKSIFRFKIVEKKKKKRQCTSNRNSFFFLLWILPRTRGS